MLELVGDVLGLLDLAEWRGGVLEALARAVPADYVSINEIAEAPEEIISVVRPELPAKFYPAFAALAHENPLIQRFSTTSEGRPYRFSDVVTMEQLQATALYREVYEPLGIRHQIAFTLPAVPGRIVGIALSRGDPDFTEAERDLLDRARPYLIQTYRNAAAFGAQRAAARTEPTAAQLADGLTRAGLTRRQADVVSLVALGASNREAAARLEISERTVEKHLQRAFATLGVRTRSGARARALELLSPTDPQATIGASSPPISATWSTSPWSSCWHITRARPASRSAPSRSATSSTVPAIHSGPSEAR